MARELLSVQGSSDRGSGTEVEDVQEAMLIARKTAVQLPITTEMAVQLSFSN